MLLSTTAAGLISGGAVPIAGAETMRVRITRTTFAGGQLLAEGESYDLPADDAYRLLSMRKAVAADAPALEIADAPSAITPEPAAARRRMQKEEG